MTLLYNRFPTYREPLVQNGAITRGWYTFWSGLYAGQPTGPVSTIATGASPYEYIAPFGGTVILTPSQGITDVQFSRDGITFYETGATTGLFPVSQGDLLLITYSSTAPTVVFVPR